MSVIDDLISSRNRLQAELVSKLSELTGKKGKAKRHIKKAIRVLNRNIRKLNKAIKKADKQESTQSLAEQGIDSKGNMVASITTSASSIASSVFSPSGVFGSKGVFSADRDDVINAKAGTSSPFSKDNNLLKYGIISIVALVLLKILKVF